jgi:16S rRNA (cytidine1402-2'-O)-methyltransferase
VRATLPELAKRFQEGARGEVVLIVEAPDEAVGEGVERPPIDEVIRARLAAGGRVKDIAQELASEYELPRQQVYAAVLRVRDEGST